MAQQKHMGIDFVNQIFNQRRQLTRTLYLTVASLIVTIITIITIIVGTCPEYVDLQILYVTKVAQLAAYMKFYHTKALQKRIL
jgi:hypothetical protein